MDKKSKIYISGHRGLVGSSIVRQLKKSGYTNLILKEHNELDLEDAEATKYFFTQEKPEYVFNAAAYAGGIKRAIEFPYEMLIKNLHIQTNVIHNSYCVNVKKLLYLGSSCIYPVDGIQPYREEQIFDGKTDENWSYAATKRLGIIMCNSLHRQYGCNFMTAIPCNLYGINDNFGENGHVIPSLIRKISESDTPEIWSGGNRRREFLYVDNFAEAAVMLMENYNYEHLYDGVINIGSSHEYMIKDVADIIRDIINPDAVFIINSQTPSGVSSKLMDSSRINSLGWKPKTYLKEGIKNVYEWYKETNGGIV